jgi:hypothetical protein
VTRRQSGRKNPSDVWDPEALVRLFAGIRTVGSGAGADREDLGGDGGIGGGGAAARGAPRYRSTSSRWMTTVGSMYSGGWNADDEARSISTVGSTEVASGTLPRPPCVDLNEPGVGVCPDRPEAADDMRASSRVLSARAPAWPGSSMRISPISLRAASNDPSWNAAIARA